MSSWSMPIMLVPLRLRTPTTLSGHVVDARPPCRSATRRSNSSCDERLAEQADHGDVADVLVGERLALGRAPPSRGRGGGRAWCRRCRSAPSSCCRRRPGGGRGRSGRGSSTAGHSWPIASASSGVSVLMLPLPRLTPLLDAAPAWTSSVLAPMLARILLDRRRRPLADLGHGDQRRDADDDAERRQDRAHDVPAQRAQGHRGVVRAKNRMWSQRPGAAAGCGSARPRLEVGTEVGRHRRTRPGDRSRRSASASSTASSIRPSRMRMIRLGVGGDRGVVRHQDDRDAVLGVELLEHAEDLLAGLRVEVAGRLVGDQERAVG